MWVFGIDGGHMLLRIQYNDNHSIQVNSVREGN